MFQSNSLVQFSGINPPMGWFPVVSQPSYSKWNSQRLSDRSSLGLHSGKVVTIGEWLWFIQDERFKAIFVFAGSKDLYNLCSCEASLFTLIPRFSQI